MPSTGSMHRSNACTGPTCRCPMPPISRRWPCRSSKTSSRPRARSATADARPETMSINILMPALSPTMTEGKLAKWHVKVGDAVTAGQVVCEIETDKATMEVEAVDEGTVAQILIEEGVEGVKVNTPILVLAAEGESVADAAKAAPAAAAPAAEAPKAEAPAAAKAA